MPKTNPPQGSNNYGLYGFLVILLTAGYHHYFAASENSVVIKKDKTVPVTKVKANKIEKPKEKIQSVAQVDVQNEQQVVAAKVDEELIDFSSENERENCWDYIHRNLTLTESESQKNQDKVFKYFIKKYPSWYLYGAGDLFDDPPPKVLTDGTLFIDALRSLKMADRWNSTDSINPKAGIKTLLELHKKKPQNSAYVVYLALAYDRNNKQDEVQKILNKLKFTTYFSTHESEYVRDIYAYPENLSEFLAVRHLLATSVGADVYILGELAKKYDLSTVALQILDKSDSKSKNYDAFDSNFSQYTVALDILEKTNIELAKKHPNKKSFLKEHLRQQYLGYQVVNNALARNCEISSLQNVFLKSKEFLAKHPKKIRGVSRSLAGQ